MDLTYSDAAELRERLELLRLEHDLAYAIGLDADVAYMAELQAELARWEAAWVGAAVTEIAVERAVAHGRLHG